MKKNLNQKLISLIEYYNLINANFLLSNTPLKRINGNKNLALSGNKLQKLNQLKEKIKLIKNCELKKNATNLVFSDGNVNAKIMIIGDANEVKYPIFLFPVLKTLVAPIFPEPISLTSMLVKVFVKINPKGIEPTVYEKRTVRIKSIEY